MQALINKKDDFKALANPENGEIAAGLLTLQMVADENIHFNVPIYQRLYVWKTEQIQTLLEDIKNAFKRDPKDCFFLGGIMLSNNTEGKIDLVDGQQRFTTLWLLCDTLSKQYEDLKRFAYISGKPRIHFSIREKAQLYLENAESFKDYQNEKGDLINSMEAEISEIAPLVEGRNIIQQIIKKFELESDFNVGKFSEFVFKKIQLSQTFIPGKSDMNRVFEAMNNRGKQLEHHELLKSKLLEKIPSENRLVYALIWDACSDMNSYIEKSIKDVAYLTWKDLFSNHQFLYDFEENEERKDKYDLIQLDIVSLLKKNTQNAESSKSLLDLLKQEFVINSEKENNEIKESDYFSKTIRSIISFPAFLLHTLRIYQANHFGENIESAEINEKKLIERFSLDKNFTSEKDVIDFILLLWKLRILFDRYIIKWIYDENKKEEYHSIEYLQISKSIITNKDGSKNENISAQRVEETDENIRTLVMLEGMLYHSQEMTTQYWLTPFLHYLSKSHLSNNEQILRRLESWENELFYSEGINDKLKDRTYKIIFRKDSEIHKNLINTEYYLQKAIGTDYPNYIFYKLEFILWKNRVRICKKHGLDINKWSTYRMTAKNSVEHIFPRNAKEENRHLEFIDKVTYEKLKEDINPLDDFGNLVLLSPGMNSEYSNKSYREKKGKFESKDSIDSLKSDLIFKNKDWSWKEVQDHRNEMIVLIAEYINSKNN